ncbi:Uncharacterized [Syntrophomonas zehnderi OL-4]|uniref:Uncharacterized n=1 Tax=Syntrophomonas zehnderi OL-4 TaxID=690567 RepID=A0A0E3W2F5_9FIRM|nr:hypothetical protein [Syntrophomonas zehnderi]CFW97434.1 Uncharacterized [Syntrophomonas zehnderi OL-4]
MITGLVILVVGLLMFFYAWIHYHRAASTLSLVKQEDLVSYYLDLAIRLLPVPFWSALIGILLAFVGIIVILIKIPWVF